MNLVRNFEVEESTMAQRKRSMGELISSVTFFGAAIWLFFEAKLFLEGGDILKGVIVYVGAFLSLLASMRFTIQRLILRLRDVIWPK
jgi:hypothetical protein